MATLRISITETIRRMGSFSRLLASSSLQSFRDPFPHVGDSQLGDDQGQDVLMCGIFGFSMSLRLICSALLRPPFMPDSFLCVTLLQTKSAGSLWRNSIFFRRCWSTWTSVAPSLDFTATLNFTQKIAAFLRFACRSTFLCLSFVDNKNSTMTSVFWQGRDGPKTTMRWVECSDLT
jgi:hypothetical protein